ncbi:MAG: hypothetical protein SPL63_13725 [Roseburia faecis]|nr:hypothetical protein [Roseburia faecis]
MENTKKLDSFYIDTLKFAKNHDMTLPENKSLYKLAFFGLMRDGYKFSIREEKPEPTPEEKNGKAKAKKTASEEQPINTVVLIIDETGYSCLESDLKLMFGDMYDELLKKKTPKQISADTDDEPFFIPNVYAENPKQEALAEKQPIKSPKADTPAHKKITLPYISFDNHYENDPSGRKEYDSFLFDEHTVDGVLPSGEKKHYEAIVYPLTMNTENQRSTDILVIMTDDTGKIRTGMSKTGEAAQKSVTLEFDEISFIVRAYWSDGDFRTNVSLLSSEAGQAYISDKTIKVRPTKRTSSFYMRLTGSNGDVLDVFPRTLLHNNPRTGLAPVVVMIEDGAKRQLYTSENDNYYELWFDGKQQRIDIYWAGNSLNIMSADAEKQLG